MNRDLLQELRVNRQRSSAYPTIAIVYDTIIISDIHFGSPMCQAQALDEFLSRVRVQQLILAGDIFDDLRFHRLQHWHWQALSRIRKISDHCRVVWIRGNHDIISARTMSHLLGVQVLNNFTWTSHGKSFYVVHGDCWDTFIYKHQILTAVTTSVYNLLQKLNGHAVRMFSKWLKKKAKLLTRNSQAVQFGALNLARRHDLDAIFCGHTHMPALTKEDGIVYGNDGTWQSADPHFIGISGTRVDLCKYLDQSVQIVSSEWI
ncbi:MAG TPA: UDP-2,3-diacylglucosamine diphosphatase [Acidobacteriota bacterium]